MKSRWNFICVCGFFSWCLSLLGEISPWSHVPWRIPSSQFPSYNTQQGIWFVIKPVACKTLLSINLWIFLVEREMHLRPLQKLPHDASAMHKATWVHVLRRLLGHQDVSLLMDWLSHVPHKQHSLWCTAAGPPPFLTPCVHQLVTHQHIS